MSRRTNEKSGITRYHEIYTALSQLLADGQIAPGAQMPSEPALVREYRVSRTTVRRALARLEDEGRIQRHRGRGTYASLPARRSPRRPRVTPALEAARASAHLMNCQIFSMEMVETPAHILSRDDGFPRQSLRVMCVTRFRGEPFMLATRHIDGSLSPGLARRGIGGRAALKELDRIEARGSRAEQITSAVAADGAAMRHLQVTAGAPLISVRRLVRDSRGRSLEHQDLAYRPDLYELKLNVERARANSANGRWQTSRG